MASPYLPVLAKTWASLVVVALAARDAAVACGDDVPFADPRLGQGFPLQMPQWSSMSAAMAASSGSSPACTWQASSASACTGCTAAAVSSAWSSTSASRDACAPHRQQVFTVEAAPVDEEFPGTRGLAQHHLDLKLFDPEPLIGDDLDASSAFDLAPDCHQPYVMLGGGQPRGLSTAEQIQWMCSTPHTDRLAVNSLDEDLLRALEFETCSDPEEVDRFRAERLREMLAMAEHLQQARLESLSGFIPGSGRWLQRCTCSCSTTWRSSAPMKTSSLQPASSTGSPLRDNYQSAMWPRGQVCPRCWAGFQLRT